MAGKSIVLGLALTLAAVPGHAQTHLETRVEGLEHPWSLAFLPDGRMLVTEKPGRLRIIAVDGTLSEPVSGVPEVL
jgi:glucose/arabinose dehydrogenase